MRAEPGSTRWSVVLLAVGAGVVVAFQLGKVPAALPTLRADFGLSLIEAGWLISIFNVMAVLGGMAAGTVADWLGYRRVMIGGLLLIALANLVGGLAPGPPLLFASRFLEGLGYLVVIVAVPSLLIRATSAKDQKLAFGLWGAYVPVGMTIIMLASPPILQHAGWRGLWLANAGLVALYAALLAFASRGLASAPKDRAQGGSQPAAPPRPWRDIRRVIARPGAVVLALCFMGYSANWLAVLGFLPTFLIEQRGLSGGAAAALTALALAVNAPGNFIGGVLLQRGFARWRLIAFAHGAMVVTGFAIYSSAVPDWGRYLACLLFSGLSGVLPPSVFSGAPVHAPELKLVGTVNGLIVQASNFGQMLGPPILAAFVGLVGGWQASSACVAVASLFGIACAFWLRRIERGRSP